MEGGDVEESIEGLLIWDVEEEESLRGVPVEIDLKLDEGSKLGLQELDKGNDKRSDSNNKDL